MLRLNKLTDYACLIMQYLAIQPANALCSSVQISEALDISTHTVSKLLKLLAQAKLVQSRQGSVGGYTLAKPAKKITLLDIITAIEEQPALTECSLKQAACPRAKHCNMRHNWDYVNKALQNILKSISLEDSKKSLKEHPALTNYLK